MGPPIFDVKGVETVVPGTIPLTMQELRGAVESIDYGEVVFPEEDEPTIDTGQPAERSILDHDEELPPSPRMQRIQKIWSRLRIPAFLLGGIMAAGGVAKGAEAVQNFENKQEAAKSALEVARDNVGGGLAEFTEAHAPSQDEVVTLSDGTSMPRGEFTDTINVVVTGNTFGTLDIYGNSTGANGEFAKNLSVDIPRSAMEEGLLGMKKQHAELSGKLGPVFGDNLDSVADSILRQKEPGSSNSESLKRSIERTYGASADDVMAKLEMSGMTLEAASESLIKLVSVKAAEERYAYSLSGDGPAKGYDAAAMTDAYGSSMQMNDAMYEVTAPIVGLTGAEQMKIHGEMMTTTVTKLEDGTMVDHGGVFRVEYGVGGASVFIGGLASLERGIDAKAVQQEMVAFGSALSAEVIKATNLANADAGTRATVTEKVQRVLGDQMKLVQAESDLAAAEGASFGVAEAAAGLQAARDKVDLSLKIMTAATGDNPEVQKMAAEISTGNKTAAEKILASAKVIEDLGVSQ